MARIVFKQAIDLATIDFTQFTGGSLDSFSSTEATFSSGDYSGTVTGENFNYDFFTDTASGTVHTFTASFQNEELLVATRMNVDLNQIYQDRHDSAAVIDEIFAGRDTILGSRGDDGVYGFGGNDRIDGGLGSDRLSGGDGADRYIFEVARDSQNRVPDLILDFDRRDALDLTGLGVTHDDIDIRYIRGDDVTRFRIDTDGDGDANMTILMTGRHTGIDPDQILV